MTRKISKWTIFYASVSIVGLILMAFEVRIYRLTLINTLIPISIFLFVGIGAYIVSKKHYNRHNMLSGPLSGLLQNICSWGFISCYLFMATNYYLADNETRDLKLKIESKSSMSGSKGNRTKRKPLVTIDYFGLQKELVFRYEDTEKVENADEVSLTVKSGFFGFDILDHYEPIDNLSE